MDAIRQTGQTWVQKTDYVSGHVVHKINCSNRPCSPARIARPRNSFRPDARRQFLTTDMYRRGHPERDLFEQKARVSEYTERTDQFLTVKPGLIGLLEELKVADNKFEWDKQANNWKVFPADGLYYHRMQLMRTKGEQLLWYQIALTSPERDRVTFEASEIERKLTEYRPFVYRPCASGFKP